MLTMFAVIGFLLFVIQAGATMVGILAAVYLFVQLTAPPEDRICGRPRRKGKDRP